FYKRKNGGRIDASAHVLFAFVMHLLLVAEIIKNVAAYNILQVPDFGNYGKNKIIWFLFAVPGWVGLYIFYNKARTKSLMEQFEMKYGNNTKSKNIVRVLSYVLLPMVLVITL